MILYFFRRVQYNETAEPESFGEKEQQNMEFVTLGNGMQMPQLGYGTLQIPDAECERCVGKHWRPGIG